MTVTLAELRAQIDVIDEQIVRLLHERAAIAVEVGELKKVTGQPILCEEREKQVMAKVTEAAFGQRRKMLRSSLKSLPGASKAAEALGIDLQRRAETLSVAEFVALARELTSSRA